MLPEVIDLLQRVQQGGLNLGGVLPLFTLQLKIKVIGRADVADA